MLKKVHLADLDRDYQPSMTSTQMREELAKPRSERRSLSSMPPDMSCTGEAATRMSEGMARLTSANAAARARGIANARYSATSR